MLPDYLIIHGFQHDSPALGSLEEAAILFDLFDLMFNFSKSLYLRISNQRLEQG